MTNYTNYIKNIINTETEMDKDSIEKLVRLPTTWAEKRQHAK